MSKMSLALLSDEVSDEEAMSPEVAEAAVTEVVDSPEESLRLADNLSDDIGAATTTIDEGADTSATLDRVAEKVEEAEKEGGLSAPAAEALRICIEHMTNRLGMKAPVQLASEGFGSKSTRARANKLAAEGLKEKAVEIWKMIVAAYEKVRDWIMKWIKNFFDGVTKLANRAEKIKKVAEAKVKDGSKIDPKKSKIENPSWMPLIAVNDDAPPLADNLIRVVGDRQAWDLKPILDMATVVSNEIVVIFNKPDELGIMDALNKIHDAVAKTGEPSTDKEIKSPDGATTHVISEGPLGVTSTYMHFPTAATGNWKLMNCFNATHTKKDFSKASIDVATAEQVEELTGFVIERAKDIEGARSAVSGLEGDLKKVAAEAKKQITGVAIRERASMMVSSYMAKAFMKVFTNGVVQTYSRHVNSLNGALNYGAVSLKMLVGG